MPGLTRRWGLDQGGNTAAAHTGSLEYDGSGFGAGRRSADYHDLIEAAERFDLPPALLSVAHDRQQGVGKFVRGAVLLQKFRDHILADHQIGRG